jgi:FkbH-like protein
MMRSISNGELPWLLPAPSDFRSVAKSLTSCDPAEVTIGIQRLLACDLDLNQLIRVDKLLSDRKEVLDSQRFTPLRLALLAQNTTDFLAPCIRASGARHGLQTTLYVPAYGQAGQEVMQSSSGLYGFHADAALIAESPYSLGLSTSTADSEAAQQSVVSALQLIELRVKTLREAGVALIVVQTLPVPAEPWCGHFDRRVPGSVYGQVTAFNAGLTSLAEANGFTLFDVEMLAGLVGRDRWFDAAEWNRTKNPFSLNYVPLYCEHLARILAAIRGKSRKCLVLDLDNTCWGGVIGDDGVDGIRIGQGSAEGEAHLAIQNYALSLKARGIVLAVCSKNEEAAARKPFEEHPDMALRLEDFGVFAANWNDKASNLAYIAKTLNIGTDSLVFLDDNPAERERVRQMLPEVAVPELPEDPSTYPSMLAQGGYFETVSLTSDDLHRAEQYRANAARKVSMETIGDYDTYLRSLDMVCDIRSFDEIGRSRIAQLINKSNQFNLTTRRYTETEVNSFQDDPQIFDLQVRLVDRFGDNGMISVIVFRKGADHWLCDTWLMSCRVLGRRVEEAVLAVVAAAARAAGAKTLLGEYVPSKKNMMVAEHFGKLGFQKIANLDAGGTRWSLDLDQYQSPDLPMKLTGLPETLFASETSV